MAVTIDKDQLIRLQNEKIGSLLMELELVTRQRDGLLERLKSLEKPPEKNRAERKGKG